MSDVMARFEARWAARNLGIQPQPLPTPPPADPAIAADAPARVSGRVPEVVRRRQAGEDDPAARLGGAVRGAGEFMREVFSVQNVADEIGAAMQAIEPTLAGEAIRRGALKPVGQGLVQSDDPAFAEQHFYWQGRTYPRQFADPETGETLNVSTPNTMMGRLSRLGRWMGASMAVDSDIATAGAAARVVRGATNGR